MSDRPVIINCSTCDTPIEGVSFVIGDVITCEECW